MSNIYNYIHYSWCNYNRANIYTFYSINLLVIFINQKKGYFVQNYMDYHIFQYTGAFSGCLIFGQ